MIKLKIEKNDDQQRLDRFLKKYFRNASLSYIYKLIRKDVKVNGKRVTPEAMLNEGDELTLYISDEQAEEYSKKRHSVKAKKQFRIAYEDENILVVEKPFGLLTHGDSNEKKNTLANQVIDYLIEQGEYNPRAEKTFIPAAANRLDRNTTGLVLFGKNSMTLRSLNKMIREKGFINKYYMTIAEGELKKELHMIDKMEKDEERNKTRVISIHSKEGKLMETIARPVVANKNFTLVEVEIITGRTHQIRAHLGKAGYPVLGDFKYGDKFRKNDVQKDIMKRYNLSTQLLHAYRLKFEDALEPLEYMKGKEIICEIPENFEAVKRELFPNM